MSVHEDKLVQAIETGTLRLLLSLAYFQPCFYTKTLTGIILRASLRVLVMYLSVRERKSRNIS